MKIDGFSWSQRYEKALGSLFGGAAAGVAFGWVHGLRLTEEYESPVTKEVKDLARFLEEALEDWDRFEPEGMNVISEACFGLRAGYLRAFTKAIDRLEEAMEEPSEAARAFGKKLVKVRRASVRKRMERLLTLLSRASEDPAYMILHRLYLRTFQFKAVLQNEGSFGYSEQRAAELFFDIWSNGLSAERLTKVLVLLRRIRVQDKGVNDSEVEELDKILEKYIEELEVEELWNRSTAVRS